MYSFYSQVIKKKQLEQSMYKPRELQTLVNKRSGPGVHNSVRGPGLVFSFSSASMNTRTLQALVMLQEVVTRRKE